MDDRTLLENAAKAAGLQTRPDWFDPLLGVAVVEDMRGPAERWNPLRDDALALRLAVKLDISILFDVVSRAMSIKADTPHSKSAPPQEPMPKSEAEKAAATRRAIVMAAAKIGAAAG